MKQTSSNNHSKKYNEKLTILLDDHQIKKIDLEVVNNLISLKNKLSEGKLTFDYGGRPIKGMSSDIVRVISQTELKTLSLECYKNIYLNAVISLEKRSIFSGLTFLSLFEQDNVKSLSYRLRSTKDDVHKLVMKHIGSGICYSIFCHIFETASLFSEIEFIESKTATNFKISTSGGKKILGDVDMIFKSPPNELISPRVLFLDGIIEKVSELHKILEESSQEKKDIVIFAHGFAPDVVHTLSENFRTGRLRVIPFVVKDKQNEYQEFELGNHFVIRKENFREMSLVGLDELSEAVSVSFQKGSCTIHDNSVDNLKTVITIPEYFKNQAGIITDRVKSAVEYGKDISKHGVVLDESLEPLCCVLQRKEALKTYESFKESNKNLGCIVTHRR